MPTKLSEQLAELVGIIIGDGHITIQKNKENAKRKYTHYQIFVTGSLTEDMDYFHKTVNPLFFSNFNIKLNILKYEQNNYFNAVRDSKAIVYYLNKLFEIPIRKKSDIVQIPKAILNSSVKEKTAFIRGVSDTDFCLTLKKGRKNLHTYPAIKGKFRSPYLVQQLADMLKSLNFRLSVTDTTYYDKRFKKTLKGEVIQILGEKNLEKWMSLIGFNNPRHYTKYLIWKKFGFCPPYTTLEQRKQILAGELDPYSFYK